MPAYIIVDVAINDPVEYEAYKKLTPASLIPYDGKFIVRGGPTETLEGEWQPGRFVVLEFPSTEKAKAWWSSPGYAPAKAIRQRTASTQMILVKDTVIKHVHNYVLNRCKTTGAKIWKGVSSGSIFIGQYRNRILETK